MRCLPLDRHALVGLLAVLVAVLLAPAIAGGPQTAVAGSATARAAQSDQRAERPADERFPMDGQAIAEARRIADRTWGATPCKGQVALSWAVLNEGTNATATWKNPTDAWNNAPENFDCKIEFNARGDFDWPKLCTVMAHELGHLLGKQHGPDDGSLMAPMYRRPLQACADTPEPGAPAASASSSQRRSGSAASRPSVSTFRATPKGKRRAKAAGKASYGRKRGKGRKARAARKRAVARCMKRRRLLLSASTRRTAAIRTARCKRTVVALRKAR